MNESGIVIKPRVVKKKASEIGEIIDGESIANVFCIISTVIIEIVMSSISQGVDVREAVVEWLRKLIDGVRDCRLDDVEMDDEIAS